MIILSPLTISTALPGDADRRNKLPAYQTYFAEMPSLWREGNARIARVCLAISAKANPTTGVTYTVGGVEQNPMLGIASANSGIDIAPPVSDTYANYNLDAEGRELIVWSGRVGAPYRYINGGGGAEVNLRSVVPWFEGSDQVPIRPVFRASAHSGMSYTPSLPVTGLHVIVPGWSNFTGTPESGSDTTFNVSYVYFEFERLSATTFRMRAAWHAINNHTAGMNFASGQTLAQIKATCDEFAQGVTAPNGLDLAGSSYTITTAIDPKLIFAEYPYAVFHNPFPHELYLMHTSIYPGA